MYNTIFNIIDGLRMALLTVGLPIYKEVRPESESGSCLVLTYVPRKKTNVNSINDILVDLYISKMEGQADTASIENYCGTISSAVRGYVASNGVVFPNEQVEPETTNMDGFTVTKYKFY